MNNKPDPYTLVGVNNAVGDSLSSYFGAICRDSYGNSPFVIVEDMSEGHFRGPRGFQYPNLPEGYLLTGGMDGTGSKPSLSSAAGGYGNAGRDLASMTLDDIVRYGGLPLVLLNQIDAQTFGDGPGHPAFLAARSLVAGLAIVAKEQCIVLLNGETAELPDHITSDNHSATLKYVWSGAALGVYHKDKMILGKNVRPGNRIIALRDVTRCNGISLIRKALVDLYGPRWFDCEREEVRVAVEEAATPSIVYSKFLSTMNGWWNPCLFNPVVKANLIAHLSGGGIKYKFGELLFATGFSANLPYLWEPSQVMKDSARVREVDDEKCYEKWGGGQGALVVVEIEDARKFIEQAGRFGIEARDAGFICPTPAGFPPSIQITSKFTGKVFSYEQES